MLFMDLIITIGGIIIGAVLVWLGNGFVARKNLLEDAQSHAILIKQAKLRADIIKKRAEAEFAEKKDWLEKQAVHEAELIQEGEKHIAEREKALSPLQEHLKEKVSLLAEKKSSVDKAIQKFTSIKSDQLLLLEKIAKLSKTESLAILSESIVNEEIAAQEKRSEKLLYSFNDEVEEKAKAIMNVVNQRYVGESTRDPTLIEIEFNDRDFERIVGDEQMSKIIHLQTALGTELKLELVEKNVRVFGYDLWRRYLIKGALERMKKDNKMSLEAAIEDTKLYTEARMMKLGKRACLILGIKDFPPELVKLVGRLDYRTSFGQNIYRHSIEVAILARMFAEEIGCDPYISMVGGLLHDIGKGVDADVAGAHDVIGRDIALDFHLHPDIVHAIYAHHEAEPYRSVEAKIAQLADAISAARPGARHHESLEDYIARMQALEGAALGQEGVEKAFVIQAGREIRAFVDPEKVNDEKAKSVADHIVTAVQASNAVRSGEVKIQVIREFTTNAYATDRKNKSYKTKR